MKPFIRTTIIESYCWAYSAKDLAEFFNHFYKIHTLTAAVIEDIWAEEIKICTPMRELGERPLKGFAQTDHVKIVTRLLAGKDIPLAPAIPPFAHGKDRSLQGGSSA